MSYTCLTAFSRPNILLVHIREVEKEIMSSRHRDFVAQVWKCGSRSLGLLFPVPWPSIFFNCSSIDEQYSYVRAFFDKYWRCDFFFHYSSTTLQHSVFCPYFFVFWVTSQADYDVGDMNPLVHHPGTPSLIVYTSTRWILGDFINVCRRDFCREIA